MELNNIIVLIALLLILFLSMGVTTANENATVESLEINEEDTSLDLNENNGEIISSDDDIYNAKIIAKDITLEYSEEDYELSIYIEDNNHKPITDAEPRFDGYLDSWGGYEGQYYFFPMYLDVGTHNVEFTLDDGFYKAKPVAINLKILPSTFTGDIKCESYYGTDNGYLTMKATVSSDTDYFDDGYVTFKVNGKSYTVKTKNGVATKKIKLKKGATYTYTAKFSNENYKTSLKTGKSKLYVHNTSKKARTLKIKGYKIVLSKKQFKKLVYAKNTKKIVGFDIKTKKFINQKVGSFYGKLKTKKARVILGIVYGGKSGCADAPANKYRLYTYTYYQSPAYDICKPVLCWHKQSTVLNKLNKAKAKKWY